MSQNTTRGTAKTRKAKEAKRNARGLPSREQILEFLAANPKAGKREIGRAFQVKGSAKIDLKALLKEMAEEGVVEKRGKRIVKVGTLPPVTVIDIVARDRQDTTRAASPLMRAEDAIEVDTSDMSLDGVIDRIIAIAREAL